jgi:CheY-like chemotaxis protein
MTQKLLLADDSVTVQRVIELTFADENMQVVAVGDGSQAIERLERERPDIVLADVSMPLHDGYEVAAHIKGTPHLAHIPVVLMTGAFEQIDEARARAVGCDGVLAKPFEPHMVIALVRQLLGKAEAAPAGRGAAVASFAAGYPFEPAATAATSSSLDDYFDRLDEALAGHPAVAGGSRVESSASADVPAAPRPGAGTAPAASSLADAFSALLADELGETSPATWQPQPAAPPVPATASAPPGPSAAPAGPSLAAFTDEVIDELARRVVTRLGEQAVRDLVAPAVLDVAERLVREEIERIKSQA